MPKNIHNKLSYALTMLQRWLSYSAIWLILFFIVIQKDGYAQPFEGTAHPKLEEKVDEMVQKMMQEHHLFGMTVAVTQDGRLLLSKGYGLAGLTKSAVPKLIKMHQNTRTRIGSVSKVTVTSPAAYKLMQKYNIDPFTKTLFGNTGVFRFLYDEDISIGSKRYRPIVAMAISPDDKVYTWYTDSLYSIGTSFDLDKYQEPKPFKLPKNYVPTDIRAIAISRKNRVYVWYRNGRRSVGRPDHLSSRKQPDEKVVLPSGKTMWNIVGIAIAKSNDRVYVWYDDGTVSSGTSMDFGKHFRDKKYNAPLKDPGTMSVYDIRGIGISKKDWVYIWYSNGKASSGSSRDLDKYRSPYPYTLPEKYRYQNPSRLYKAITLNHILTHTSGFERDFDHSGGARTMFPLSLDDKPIVPLVFRLKHLLRTRPLRWEPGERYAYSNVGYALWGLIFPRLGNGQSYDQWVRDHFLTPLGLRGRVRLKTAMPDAIDAFPYNYDPKEKKRILLDFTNAGEERSAGGWTASAKELLWITRHLSRKYSEDELKAMGWQASKDTQKQREKLSHNGVTSGGMAYVAMYPKGFKSEDGVISGNIHVALATNTRPLNIGNNNAQDKAIGAMGSLALDIALAVGKSDIASDYNIWGGFAEFMRFGVASQLFNYAFEHGYRAIWLDAYTVKGKTFFNLILRPQDGTSWLARHGLSSSQYQELVTKWSAKGYRLHLVDSYVENNTIRYAAIMVKRKGPVWRAYHGKTATQHQQLFQSLVNQGYRPINISVTSLNGDVRIAALYEKRNVGWFVSLTAIPVSLFQKKFDEMRQKGGQLVYLNAWRKSGKTYFSAIWHSKPKSPYAARHGMSWMKYQTEWEKYMNKGYLTQFVIGYQQGNQHLFAAYWRKQKGKKKTSVISTGILNK